ncbi:cysteinyl-tRNA synthetase [Apostasia shenzhenica]|uniref:cysteine--tRNA ligase n=1 Tax=Apostasia shenzhenica TaxID=1088818 RepID=A0A2I0ALY2_9ASPA|nr:cysteinyl-tRNA synthetase [Apostasia shenzhenica]
MAADRKLPKAPIVAALMSQATAWLRCSSLFLSPPATRSLSGRRRRSPFAYPVTTGLFPSLFLTRRTKFSLAISRTHCSLSSSSASVTFGREATAEFYLYNTLTKRKELFRPRVEGKVGMYVCGVTAYDLSHIGHARAYVSFDVLYRFLKHLRYEVLYVRNFTDVDDKIIARANELGEDPLILSSRFCDEFHSDMVHLNCLLPTVEPCVSTHMNQIIDMIKKILDNGFAYRIDDDVYFSVDKFPLYGQLSGRRLEDNRAGERSSKAGEPFWESPWGRGRPGWHIECSAMSAAYLGYSFDIHGGGMDLVFPHHENEIAQSCAACKGSSISYWVHNGFVNVESEKMSKSLGNFITIRQVIDLYHPMALRLFLIGTHYRSPINYSSTQLEVASDRLYYIYQTMCDCEKTLIQNEIENLKGSVPADIEGYLSKFRVDFEQSLADDLHTSVALASFSEPLKIVNDLLHTRKGKKQQMRIDSLRILEKEIKDGLAILGLKPSSFTEALVQLREKALRRAGIKEEQVLQRMEERSSARNAKQYEKSDEIRKELASVGITLMDGPDGTTWRPGLPLHVQEKLAPAA